MTDRPADSGSPFGPALWEVLARYTAGESPSDEAAAVRQWLAEDPSRGELLAAIERSLRAVAFTPPLDLDVEAALRRVNARLAEPDVRPLASRKPARPSHGWRTVGLRAAATAILLIGATVVWWSSRPSGMGSNTLVAARTYQTPVGQTDSVRLDDGSLAILGPGSTLEVAAGYGGKTRSVELQGVALFDVMHDEMRPFTVRAGVALIKDLGTTFSVHRDAEDSVHVVVTSGSVLLQGSEGPKQGTSKPRPEARKEEGGVVLKAGDRGKVGRGGQPVAERAAVKDDDLAWTRGRLLFEDAPLSRVRADLRRWYGIDLVIADASLANRHLTASFAGEPAEQVLNVIALALGARIDRQGTTAVIRAK